MTHRSLHHLITLFLLVLACSWPALAQQNGQWAPGQGELHVGLLPGPGITVMNTANHDSADPLADPSIGGPAQGHASSVVAFPRVLVHASAAALPSRTDQVAGAAAPGDIRRITLPEAQEMAGQANNPLLKLAEFQVEAAKQHRLGVQSMYFPNISGQFLNLHMNKLPGEVLAIRRPLGLPPIAFPINIVEKNSTSFNFAVVQPVTPIFQIMQLVKLARADENIARAKAGMPVVEAMHRAEAGYYALLVAQRERIAAKADARRLQARWLSAGTPVVTRTQESDMFAAEKTVALAESKVKELTLSLDQTLGLPGDTVLELVAPDPLVENVTLQQVAAETVQNPEIVEAEQTAAKARAGQMLAKLEYMPSVAIVGGYTNQNMMNIILPGDYSYVGFMATYTVFDFGKRERGVKERNAQVAAADLGVMLTKAKVAGEVKKAYLQLEKARALSQLAQRMASRAQMLNAAYQPDDPEIESARARIEAEMFQAELEHRQAYARLKSLLREK